MPAIGLSTVTLSHIRRTDNSTKFSFAMDGTTDHNDTFWINQKDFNYVMFEFNSLYEPPPLSYRPIYIHDAGFGIVGGQISVNISKIPRLGGTIRDVAFTKQYICPGLSDTVPNKNISNCIITENQFYINLEDGDWFTIQFSAKSGGFRKVLNASSDIFTQIYTGQTDQKIVEFKFDFEIPEHCSETNSTAVCTSTDFPLRIANEFTRSSINITWGGWTDTTSGMKSYHLEIFKLSVNLYGNLTEISPLNPIHSADINHTRASNYSYVHTPRESGMYSVLLQATDKANNSKIARRLVLYDSLSNISLNEDTLFVSSAVNETGYMWQTSKNGTKTEYTVQWTNHFFNKFISDGKLLNKVSAYPIQFQEIQNDGILKSEKFVFPGFDDNEGQRTIQEKPNKNGIVRFEVNAVYSDNTNEPTIGWIEVNGLSENYTFSEVLRDGKTARVWVRAHDILGNVKVDSTSVQFDSTPPNYSQQPTFFKNQNGTYNHTSRLKFDAWDSDSGVHKIGFRLIRADTSRIQYSGYAAGSLTNISCNSKDCYCVFEKCFTHAQILDLDTCWFMMAKEDIDKVNVTVEVTVYNQALLETKFNVTVDKIHEMGGLETYSGPTNIRVTKSNTNSIRLEWDLPDTESCYGRTDIVIILHKQDGSTNVYTVNRNTRFVDMIGLDASQEYKVVFSLGFEGQRLGNMPYTFRTPEEDKSMATGAIVGGVIAAVIIVALVITIIVLIRRGKLEPVRRRLRPLTVRIRNSIKGRSNNSRFNSTGDELYIYGGMTFDERQPWHMSRNTVTLECLMKSGHFANIYKASVFHGTQNKPIAVAKCLKEGHSNGDKELMMAKINFTGTQLSDHPNVLKFIGAVLDDDDIGPFMLYEYCENGNLRDYLKAQRNNITLELQENMFRYGFDCCKGMEYLASRKIVHRRLAARNILLNFLNEVKIYGFGPQKFEVDDDCDIESGKKERIPIKWMAPECMDSTAGATEKSDVWSYGVVLWEIFSLGETPYPTIRSRDLPARLRKGERLPKPELCDDMWYGLMQKTWNKSPDKRPTFSDVTGELENLFVQPAGDDIYYYKR
ncbi:hypothetical protein ACJMK2_023760 [Sinanodonta woodiana]|uniref:Protein kinase domain-containing protein n=1 Tax=Sinanodonta woodiana TaxID=1069815 RepID=A0ABD3T596_SINWO